MKSLWAFRYLNIKGWWVFFLIFAIAPQTVFAQEGLIPVPREMKVIGLDPQMEGRPGLSGSVLGMFGYDTNISYGSGDDSTPRTQFESPVPGLSMAIIPSVRFTSPQWFMNKRDVGMLHYGAELQAVYRQFYSPEKSGIYNDPRFGAHVGGNFMYVPNTHFLLQAYEIFDRHAEPHYMVRDTFTMSWIQNQAGLLMRIVPGDELFETVIRYNMGLYYFEDADIASSNKIEHNFQARLTYRFLPHSLLWFVGSYDINSYFENGSIRNSMPVKVSGGLFTPLWGTNMALNLGGGYGWGFYSSGASPSTWLAFMGFQYVISTKIKLSVQYEHIFNDSLLGSYSDEHNFIAGVTMPFGERMLFTGQAGYQYLRFYGVVHEADARGDDIRVDNVVFAKLQLGYKLRNDLILRASYHFMTDQTPYRTTTPPHPNPGDDFPLTIDNNPSFTKNELFLQLSWFF